MTKSPYAKNYQHNIKSQAYELRNHSEILSKQIKIHREIPRNLRNNFISLGDQTNSISPDSSSIEETPTFTKIKIQHCQKKKVRMLSPKTDLAPTAETPNLRTSFTKTNPHCSYQKIMQRWNQRQNAHKRQKPLNNTYLS